METHHILHSLSNVGLVREKEEREGRTENCGERKEEEKRLKRKEEREGIKENGGKRRNGEKEEVGYGDRKRESGLERKENERSVFPSIF